MNKLLLFLLLFSLSIPLYSQSKELKGKVFGIDAEGKKESLPRATIMWLGTKSGTITDSKGNFTIERNSESNKLIVRYVGYLADTIQISANQSSVDIILKAEFTTDEVKVVGRQMSTLITTAEPVKTEIITLRGLQKAACCNLSESFTTNPSVDVSYSDAISGAKQIKLLGLEGSYTQMLIERLPNMRGLASAFGMNYIPGTWMESIHISKGASSVIDGYESITGQINVEYKKPEKMEATLINGYLDNSGRFEANFDSGLELGENLWTMFFGHGSLMRSEVDRNGDGFLDKPMNSQINLMNRWKYASEVYESMTGIKALYENRQGGQIGFFPSLSSDIFGMEIETQRYEFFTKNGFVFDSKHFTSLGSMVSASYHKQNSFFGRNKYIGEQKNLYANLLFQSTLIDGDLTDDGSSNFESGEHTEPVNYIVGGSFIYDNYNERFNDSLFTREELIPGIYGELTVNAIEKVSIVIGSRVDFHNLFGTFFTPRLHIKYGFNDESVLRASAGKGYHIPNIFAENTGLMSSSRKFIIQEEIRPESAWNFGLNASTKAELFGIDITFNAEFYHTFFENQMIVDTDLNPQEVHFYNLRGESYSNSFQFDMYFEPFFGFEVMAAYRLNDVKYTIGNELREKPLISPYKLFLNLAYTTDDDEWKFDITGEYNSSGRLPNTSQNPAEYRLDERFPAFILIHSQITKKFGDFELYVGTENLLDYKQPNPILAYDKPFSSYFDSSMIWGPVLGRMIHMGFRLNI